MNTEDRVNKALFEPKPMQRAKARRINPAEKTLKEIADVLGIKKPLQKWPHAVRRFKPE